MKNPIKELNDYFSDERKWCKRVLAIDSKGVPVYPLLEERHPFQCCLIGAIMLTTNDHLMRYDDVGNNEETIDVLYACLPSYQVASDNWSKRSCLVYFNNDYITTFSIFKAFLNRAEALWDRNHAEEKHSDISVFTEKVLEDA